MEANLSPKEGEEAAAEAVAEGEGECSEAEEDEEEAGPEEEDIEFPWLEELLPALNSEPFAEGFKRISENAANNLCHKFRDLFGEYFSADDVCLALFGDSEDESSEESGEEAVFSDDDDEEEEEAAAPSPSPSPAPDPDPDRPPIVISRKQCDRLEEVIRDFTREQGVVGKTDWKRIEGIISDLKCGKYNITVRDEVDGEGEGEESGERAEEEEEEAEGEERAPSPDLPPEYLTRDRDWRSGSDAPTRHSEIPVVEIPDSADDSEGADSQASHPNGFKQLSYKEKNVVGSVRDPRLTDTSKNGETRSKENSEKRVGSGADTTDGGAHRLTETGKEIVESGSCVPVVVEKPEVLQEKTGQENVLLPECPTPPARDQRSSSVSVCHPSTVLAREIKAKSIFGDDSTKKTRRSSTSQLEHGIGKTEIGGKTRRKSSEPKGERTPRVHKEPAKIEIKVSEPEESLENIKQLVEHMEANYQKERKVNDASCRESQKVVSSTETKTPEQKRDDTPKKEKERVPKRVSRFDMLENPRRKNTPKEDAEGSKVTCSEVQVMTVSSSNSDDNNGVSKNKERVDRPNPSKISQKSITSVKEEVKLEADCVPEAVLSSSSDDTEKPGRAVLSEDITPVPVSLVKEEEVKLETSKVHGIIRSAVSTVREEEVHLDSPASPEPEEQGKPSVGDTAPAKDSKIVLDSEETLCVLNEKIEESLKMRQSTKKIIDNILSKSSTGSIPGLYESTAGSKEISDLKRELLREERKPESGKSDSRNSILELLDLESDGTTSDDTAFGKLEEVSQNSKTKRSRKKKKRKLTEAEEAERMIRKRDKLIRLLEMYPVEEGEIIPSLKEMKQKSRKERLRWNTDSSEDDLTESSKESSKKTRKKSLNKVSLSPEIKTESQPKGETIPFIGDTRKKKKLSPNGGTKAESLKEECNPAYRDVRSPEHKDRDRDVHGFSFKPRKPIRLRSPEPRHASRRRKSQEKDYNIFNPSLTAEDFLPGSRGGRVSPVDLTSSPETRNRSTDESELVAEDSLLRRFWSKEGSPSPPRKSVGESKGRSSRRGSRRSRSRSRSRSPLPRQYRGRSAGRRSRRSRWGSRSPKTRRRPSRWGSRSPKSKSHRGASRWSSPPPPLPPPPPRQSRTSSPRPPAAPSSSRRSGSQDSWMSMSLSPPASPSPPPPATPPLPPLPPPLPPPPPSSSSAPQLFYPPTQPPPPHFSYPPPQFLPYCPPPSYQQYLNTYGPYYNPPQPPPYYQT